MKEVVEFLRNNPIQYLATVGRDEKAKCRPFMFCFAKEEKLWFCTGNHKDVYREMIGNPYVEICINSKENHWIRINGRVVFENNIEIKEKALEIPIVKGNYLTVDNPIFEVFYLDDAKATMYDFSGNPPRELLQMKSYSNE